MRKVVWRALAAVALISGSFCAGTSSAKPCPGDSPHDENLALVPTGRVTIDGSPLQRSTNGRYVTDAGLDFDVNGGTVVAIDPRTTCFNDANEVTLELINPFTGAVQSVRLGVQ